MNQFTQKLLVITLMFLSLACHAESDMDKAVQFKIASLQLLSSFSSYIYFEGDSRNQVRLHQAKIQGDKALLELSVPNQELSLKWKQISDYLDSSQGDQFDVNLEAGWSILQLELSQTLETYEAGLAVDKETVAGNNISNLQVKMEIILSRYMAFANSTLGGYGITSKGDPLEDQIKAVSVDMAELVEKDAKYKPLARKWRYIEKTLLAYNSDVAPFVVMHTYGKMREMLAVY
ncbi:MAG: hypothetical protein JKX82_02355 [Oleispira sp.]|nr:hypothetical protein [Oleispira sp.]